MNYYQKYLKYKEKYLQLKKQTGGIYTERGSLTNDCFKIYITGNGQIWTASVTDVTIIRDLKRYISIKEPIKADTIFFVHRGRILEDHERLVDNLIFANATINFIIKLKPVEPGGGPP